MKRKNKILIIFLLLITCSIIQSCLTAYYRITDIEFYAIGDYENRAKVLNGKIVFIVRPDVEFERSAHISGIISPCYAMTTAKDFINPLVIETFSLSFNKPFIYRKKIIPAFSNIFDNYYIKKEISIDYDRHPFSAIKISLSDHFTQNSIFENTLYNVEFICETSDNEIFIKNESVIIK